MTQRTEKVQALAREVLGDAIRDLKDPRIGFVTVTSVRVTPDLRHARVWVSVMGTPEEQESTMAGLRSASRRLRLVLGREVRLKYLPELVFELDHTPEDAQRIEEMLRTLHEGDEEAK